MSTDARFSSFTSFLRHHLSDQHASFNVAKHLSARPALLHKKKVAAAVKKDMNLFTSKKLNWRIFADSIPETALNFQGAYNNFNQFVLLVREMAGEELAAHDLFGLIYNVFQTCAEHGDEARQIIRSTLHGAQDVTIKRACKLVVLLNQWKEATISAAEKAAAELAEERAETALKDALSGKKKVAPAAAASAAPAVESVANSSVFVIAKPQVAAPPRFLDRPFGSDLVTVDSLSWVPPPDYDELTFDPDLQIAAPSAPSTRATERDVSWVRINVEKLTGKSGQLADEQTLRIAMSLASTRSEESLQAEMFDLLGADAFEFLIELLQNRQSIVDSAILFGLVEEPSKPSSASQPAVIFRGDETNTRNLPPPRLLGNQFSFTSESAKEAEKSRRKDERRMLRRSEHDTDCSKSAIDQDKLDAQASMFADAEREYNGRGFASKMALPEGTKRMFHKGYEEVFVPAPPKLQDDSGNDEQLVQIADLDEFAQIVFRGTKCLNRLQSAVFRTAYHSNENMLVCAPTGAGKTNVAMLTVLREIMSHVEDGVLSRDDFKIVYVAPMKALAQEVVEKFSQRLSPLGMVVRELTGDMQLTKNEIAQTQIIVTTPEKWDVVTRKSGDGSLMQLVKLLIIDEVHLLHEDRGAVIESVVARTLRMVESSQSMIRIVGLSATLPNYHDVAVFLRVNPDSGLFFFDNRYRPVPLDQTYIGVTEPNIILRKAVMNEVCFKKVLASVQQGHQVMVFVHSRKDTVMTSLYLREQFREAGRLDLLLPDEHKDYEKAKFSVSKSRNNELRELFMDGLSFHNAGMLRSDRSFVEQYFTAGVIRVLVCTATLAWGINMPAHTVVIRGTQIYDAKKGGFNELSMLDVMQMFGRAGRPQYDTSGEAILITSHDQLSHYLNLLNHAMPIESTFIHSLENHLNAEIISGTVTNMKEAINWLSYTYLYVRMLRNPMAYGIPYDERAIDHLLLGRRKALIELCAQQLHKCRMIRFDQASQNFFATDLGRVASHYYVDYRSVETFNEKLKQFMTDEQILDCIASSREFEQVKLREEEQDELEAMMVNQRICWFEVVGGSATSECAKTNILLQAYISGARIDSFTLVSDQSYIVQSAGRIVRALFEIALKRGWTYCASRLLDYCKIIDRRQWDTLHPLRQFSSFKMEWARKLEEKSCSLDRLRDMEAADVGALLNLNTPIGKDIKRFVSQFPRLLVDALAQPITRSVLRISVTLTPDFKWHDSAHGSTEPFWIWVEDSENEHIYHCEYFLLHKTQVHEPQKLEFTVPVFDPPPAQYLIVAVSDRWLGSKTVHTLSFKHLIMPESHPPHTNLLNLFPLPLDALNNHEYQKLFGFTHFNPIQTQVFHTLYHTDNNVLLGAPTGSGKTIVAELAIFRLMNINPDLKCVYIAPLKALARERIDDWSVKFGKQLGRRVVELTGDVTPDTMALNAADIIITTPEKWDGISRHWQMRSYVQKVGLVVIDEIHLLGGDRGPVLEVIVSRMRYIAAHSREQNPVRLVGLSTALANAHDLADWLGIGKVGLYNFPPSVRPVPLTVHISGFPGKHYCPRMATMNKPAYAAITTYSPAKPVLVFVSSRRQTRLTALDLISFLAADGDPRRWLNIDSDSLEAILSGVQDQSLRHCLAFGVGLHHAGLQEDDRKIVENLFCEQKIQILVCTSTLAWGVNFPAHLVVIKGTEYYDAKVKRYVDFPITDVLQMMGRAGRPQFDTEARACILVHEPKKTFYRKFLYEPFPVESSLLTQLHDHLNAEVCGGTMRSVDDAVDWLSWTYAFRRIIQNPSYYHIESNEPDAIGTFLKNTVARVFSELAASGCLTFDEESGEVAPTALGRIASFYYLDYKTIARFTSRLNSSMELPAIVNALSAAAEFDEFPVRHNEDLVNAELSRIVPWPVDGHPPACFETPHAKVSLLLQCHFSHLPLPVSDYYTDTKSVLDQTLRVCNAIIDIAAEYGWLSTVLRTMNLVQMVVQGRWLHESTLLNLPHATSKMTIAFKKRGLECLPQVMDALTRDSNAVVQILRDSGLSAKQSADVQSVLRKLPVLEVERSISSTENTMTIALSLNRTNQDAVARGSAGGGKAVRAYTPYFPKPKEEGWWIVIGRGIELLALKRSALTHGRCKVNVDIPYSAEPITVYVMSDCYLGLDQQYECQIPSE